jgi:hypothetical protein
MEIDLEQGSWHGDAVEISKPTMSKLAVSGVTNQPSMRNLLASNAVNCLPPKLQHNRCSHGQANAAGAGSNRGGSAIGSEQLAKCCSPEKAISAPNGSNGISGIVRFARLNILIHDERVIDLCQSMCAVYFVARRFRRKDRAQSGCDFQPKFRTDQSASQLKGPFWRAPIATA